MGAYQNPFPIYCLSFPFCNTIKTGSLLLVCPNMGYVGYMRYMGCMGYIATVFHFAISQKLAVYYLSWHQKHFTTLNLLWSCQVSSFAFVWFTCVLFWWCVLHHELDDPLFLSFSPGPSFADTSCCYWLDGSTRVCRTSSGRGTPCAPVRFAYSRHKHIVKNDDKQMTKMTQQCPCAPVRFTNNEI